MLNQDKEMKFAETNDFCDFLAAEYNSVRSFRGAWRSPHYTAHIIGNRRRRVKAKIFFTISKVQGILRNSTWKMKEEEEKK